MNRLLLLCCLLIPALAGAKPPVEEDILSQTMNTASPHYYTSLLMRYNAGDATLTDEDYHYLYYGFAYQEAYKPLEINPFMDRVLLLAATVNPEQPDRETIEELLLAGKDALERDPFSPKLLNLMAFAYGALGDQTQEEAYFNRMNGVLRTILASGDGLTQSSPRHILMFDHAHDALTAEGFSYGKSRVVSRTVEFIPLTTPLVVAGKKRKGFYFDFNRIYWNKPEGYTYKRDRTWQFNNLKPRTYK